MISLKKSAIKMPMSPIRKPGTLPHFSCQFGEIEIFPHASLQAKDRHNMLCNGTLSLLPYTPQNNYDRSREIAEMPVINLESDLMKAVFYPAYGGRLASLICKTNGRELLFNNPVFQAANLAVRNAWFAGGIEWNGPVYGHAMHTCADVFAAGLSTPAGKLLRLYEFDRKLTSAWQVDLLLRENEERLWIHVKNWNLNPHPVDYWWWTNMAVPLTEKTRVLAPSTGDIIRHPPSQVIERVAFSDYCGIDPSYPAEYEKSDGIFFDKPAGARPWIAVVEADGTGMLHSSSSELPGRKMFTWGQSQGGRHWCDFLSLPGQGDYIEIQAGITPTQVQVLPLPGNSCLEWTECITSLDMAPENAHQADYDSACRQVKSVVDHRIPQNLFAEIDEKMRDYADLPPDEILHRGTGGGSLHEQLTGRSISPGLDFSSEIRAEEKMWQELLEHGSFINTDLSAKELSWQIDSRWMELIEKSLAETGGNWLHFLELGVAEMEKFDFPRAEKLFRQSLDQRENMHAYRNLAVIKEQAGDINAAEKFYLQAWRIRKGAESELAVEICPLLVKYQLFDHFRQFISELSPEIREHERIQLTEAAAALQQNNFSKVRKLLDRQFISIREGEMTLSEIWYQMIIREEEIKLDRKLTADELEQAIRKHPIPEKIDFSLTPIDPRKFTVS